MERVRANTYVLIGGDREKWSEFPSGFGHGFSYRTNRETEQNISISTDKKRFAILCNQKASVAGKVNDSSCSMFLNPAQCNLIY
jgi:hypothetical protein